jgi:hypothetical protein
MGDDLFKQTGRKSASEQVKEIGAAITGIFGADDEKPSGYEKVKAEKKTEPKKNVKSTKTYKKVTKTKMKPVKQVSGSPKGTSFFDMFTS